MVAMSTYNTVTSLAESPKQEGLLYAGTDDGLVQVSEDGGKIWRRVEVGSLPGVPATAFVNDLKADLFDASTVYAALDDHKSGNFRPYLLKSTDRGRTWRSIAGDLPDRHLVWRVVQDHVKPDLLFAATELGLFFTTNGGVRWTKLGGDVPTISFRDLAIQRRENDLVGASFGRGFYVLDDYSVLREATEEALAREAALFPVRKAWWYVEREPLGEDGKASQGASYFTAPNPPFGAVFTYHLADDIRSREKARQEKEKPLLEAGKDTPYPGWAEVEAERREPKPVVVLTVKDAAGNVVRRIEGRTKKGFHRVAWDLRLPAPQAVGSRPPRSDDDEGEEPSGVLAAPGTYTVSLAKQVDGKTTEIAPPVRFEGARLREGALPSADPKETAAFLARLADVSRASSAATQAVSQALKRAETLGTALGRSRSAPDGLDAELHAIRGELHAIDEALVGNRARATIEDDGPITVTRRVQVAQMGTRWSTYGPTPTHRRSLEIAEQELAKVRERLNAVLEQRLPAFEKALERAGAPWTPGRPVPPLP
jgi:hypothetical protein